MRDRAYMCVWLLGLEKDGAGIRSGFRHHAIEHGGVRSLVGPEKDGAGIRSGFRHHAIEHGGVCSLVGPEERRAPPSCHRACGA